MSGSDAALTPQSVVDAMSNPGAVIDRYLDVVAANALAGAVSAALALGSNLARFTFLNPQVEDTSADWPEEARRTAGVLRAASERFGADARFRKLVGELMARSQRFADEWAAETAVPASAGMATVDNPLVGKIVCAWEQRPFATDDELTVVELVPTDQASTVRLERLRQLLAT